MAEAKGLSLGDNEAKTASVKANQQMQPERGHKTNMKRKLGFLFCSLTLACSSGIAQDNPRSTRNQITRSFSGTFDPAKSNLLPVRASYRIDDDCVLVLQSSATTNLSLTVKVIHENRKRTNSCLVSLDGGTTKELNLLEDWILTPDDHVRVEIASPSYGTKQIWIMNCRTPSRKIAAKQDRIYQAFNEKGDQSEKDFAASTLSDLWRAGLLKVEIKEGLLQRHYQLELTQLSSHYGAPSWVVTSQQTFPFPDVYTEFTPTLYSNNEVKWSPGKPQTSFAMSVTNSPITSMTGGVFKNGDVLQCKIDLRQETQGQSWQTSLWTSKIVLRGLKE